MFNLHDESEKMSIVLKGESLIHSGQRIIRHELKTKKFWPSYQSCENKSRSQPKINRSKEADWFFLYQSWRQLFDVFFSPSSSTLQGTNISHLGKRKIIFKMLFLGDMLVPWRVTMICGPFSTELSVYEWHQRPLSIWLAWSARSRRSPEKTTSNGFLGLSRGRWQGFKKMGQVPNHKFPNPTLVEWQFKTPKKKCAKGFRPYQTLLHEQKGNRHKNFTKMWFVTCPQFSSFNNNCSSHGSLALFQPTSSTSSP